LRGYEVAAILQGHGWNNVKVMEGGIAAWPYSREK
jgi:rhodanese-related sulfurtransferase